MSKSLNHSYCLKKQFDFASIKNEYEEALKCNSKVKSPRKSNSATNIGTKYNFFQILFKYMPKEVAIDLYESFRKETNEGQLVKELLSFKDEIAAEYKNKLIEILTFFVFSNKFMAISNKRNKSTSEISLSPISKPGRKKKEIIIESCPLLITKSSFSIMKGNKSKTDNNIFNISPIINEGLSVRVKPPTKPAEVNSANNKKAPEKILKIGQTAPSTISLSKTPENKNKSPIFTVQKEKKSPDAKRSTTYKFNKEESREETSEMIKGKINTAIPSSINLINSNKNVNQNQSRRNDSQTTEVTLNSIKTKSIQRPMGGNNNINPYVNMMMPNYFSNLPNNKMINLMNMNLPYGVYPSNNIFYQNQSLNNVPVNRPSYSSPYFMEEEQTENSILTNGNTFFQREDSKSGKKQLLGNKTNRDNSYTAKEGTLDYKGNSAIKSQHKIANYNDIQIKVQLSNEKNEEEKYPQMKHEKVLRSLNATSGFNQSFQTDDKNILGQTEENFHRSIVNIFSENFDEAALDRLAQILNLTEEKINKIRRYLIEKNYPKGKKEYILLFSQENFGKGLYLKIDSLKKKYSLVKKKLE